MEQIPEDPVSVQKFRKEPGPWDPIRLSGDTGKTPRNPPLPDADNQTSRLPHTLQYEIRSPDGNSSIAVQLDQSLSSDSGYGTSTSTAKKFQYDIKAIDVHDKYKFAVAILDTGCHTGNWISRRLVERLGRQDEISHDYERPDLKDAGGHAVVAHGIISLEWKWLLHGIRWHECKFFVMEPEYLDVLFGAEYIVSEGLVTVNECAMTPMIAHNKAPTSENAEIALAREKQKWEKAALETRRMQTQQQAAQQQGGPSSQAQQSGQQGPTQTQGRQRP
ncbi:MAG: hypothetical protein L6R36_006245 [Xanthoria steineri]|nr:MAG: hypothetical protein L6R36_006245 [Xanthoria steineri]